MGQQPNLELSESDLPRSVPEPAPPRRWRPVKVGLITSPEEKPTGGLFGYTGPDPGWASRLVSGYALPSKDPDFESVIIGLTMARAAALGRAAVRGDIDVALMLCGHGTNLPEWLDERLAGWLAAAPHDQRPGQTAVADVDTDTLTKSPDQIRYLLNHSGPSPRSAKPTH